MTSLIWLGLTWVDVLAVIVIFAAWVGIGWRIEHPAATRLSVAVLMAEYRREWMRQMVSRTPRMFDSQILSTLRQGASFFASATMIAIGGGLALIGNAASLTQVATDLNLSVPAVVWEVKMALVLFFLANAFLKFVWSHRLFGYCAILMAAVPDNAADPRAAPRAAKAAAINITAAKSFNRGLRAVYFALAACGWLVGPLGLIAGAIVTMAVLWRREFASQSRNVLLETENIATNTQS